MNPIDEIRIRLKGHPSLKLDEKADFIEATPSGDGGFSVSLSNDGIHFTVSYGGAWHEHIESAQEALNCFGFGLSEQCRLKIHRAGRFEYKWTAEHRQNGEWFEISTTGLLVYAFWLPRSIVYRQNRVIARVPNGAWTFL